MLPLGHSYQADMVVHCKHSIRAYAIQLDRASKSVTIQWIPSHVGISGNERANKLGSAKGVREVERWKSKKCSPTPSRRLSYGHDSNAFIFIATIITTKFLTRLCPVTPVSSTSVSFWQRVILCMLQTLNMTKRYLNAASSFLIGAHAINSAFLKHAYYSVLGV